ncbi:VOC family protein [Craurococcus roseus]|uniref:VOC family protein n=1 Tax=Craurococcus roseus TaxID=77585 RepID=A0ABP3QE78_9PROT
MEADDFPAPAEGMLVTVFPTVADVPRSVAFYRDVLGGRVVRDEGPAIVRLANAWVLMNPGGGPTPDKPGISLAPPSDPASATCFLNLRVADIAAAHRDWAAKGAAFVTPPIRKRGEIRCYMRDPDGYLIEVGQATGDVAASA